MKRNLLMCFLMALEIPCVLHAQEYAIERRADSYEYMYDKERYDWNIKPDWFAIPSLLCVGNGSTQCSEMGGKKRENLNCSCVCNIKENEMFIKSTFGFYDKKWKCYENDKVRIHGECSNILEYNHQRTRILKSSLLTGPFAHFYIPNLTVTCSITMGKFLKCDGKWEQDEVVKNAFFLSGYYLVFKNLLPPVLLGRVIRLTVTCSGWSWKWPATTQCLLIKVKGTMTCPYPLSTSSLVMTSTIGSSLQPSSTSSGSPTPTAKVSTSIKHQIQPSNTSSLEMVSTIGSSLHPSSTLSASPTPAAKVSTPIKHEIQPTPSTVPIIPLSIPTPTSLTPLSPSSTLGLRHTRQTLNPSDRSTEQSEAKPTLKTSSETRKKSARSEDKTGLIIGAVAGVIGLAVLIIVIVIMKRRKIRDADFKNRVVVENAGYGRGQDSSIRFDHSGQQSPDEDEYSYAYNNAAQFAQIHKQGRECHANNYHEPGSSVANQVYGQTDELNQMACEARVYNTLEQPVYAKVDKSKKQYPSNPADAPIYNTLEEPEYAKVDKSLKTKLSAENHNEPLYNVLEGPETDEGLSDEPPSYQVLEGPFSEGAPVYDVLEGPESDEAPVYGALEGQDPHVYGALDMPDNQGHPEENRGYDDMVYDTVGDVINEQGDIYQELNQSGQRNSDVYQALNYPGNTMHLNELNQSHSNA